MLLALHRSDAGLRLLSFVLFLALGFGLLGFAIKGVIKLFIGGVEP